MSSEKLTSEHNKTAKFLEKERIAELVAQDFKRANILQEYGIDIFNGAKQTLEEYCNKERLDLGQIVSKLENIHSLRVASILPFDSWPLDFLSSYIVNRHHRYVYESLPLLLGLGEKLVNETDDFAVNKVSQVFKRMAKEMMLHMMKEENILFPFIEQMVEASKENITIRRPFFGTVNNPTEIMQIEHEHSWDDISLIRSLTDNFNIRGNAEPSVAILYKGLEEFEMDLLVHIDLENKILFPKAIILEKLIGLS